MKLRKLFLLVASFVFVLNLTACGEEEKPEPVVEDKKRAVVEDWVVFQVPSVLREPSLDLNMTIKEMLHDIEVVWKHPANIEEDRHTLTDFGYGNKDALYRINTAFGNLLPGRNEYEIIGYLDPEVERPEELADEPALVDISSFESEDSEGTEEEKSDRESLSMSFTIDFDLADLEDVAPEGIDVSSVPDQTDSDSLEIIGDLSVDAAAIHIHSWNDRSGKASFTKLRKFSAGDTSFTYNAEERFGNLMSGMNYYVVEARDAAGEVLSRNRFTVESSKLTLMDQVEEMFGQFEKNDQGWYVSSAKPWFSMKNITEDMSRAAGDAEERYSLLPRPSVLYPTIAFRDVPFCDYLGSIDYAEEGFSYRAYSYETCQNYRHGVAVYDRFLSLLTFEPFVKVLDVDYAGIRDKASSAFVMVETGDMKTQEEAYDELEATMEEAEAAADGDLIDELPVRTGEPAPVFEGPYYYVYQMLITDNVLYEDKKIGDIAEEADETRAQEIEEIKNLLTAHSGDELFTEMLFTGKDALESQN